MEAITPNKETKEVEESDEEKKMSAESSIFSTIIADIEENPMILQEQKRLSSETSIFSTILADTDEMILQKKTGRESVKVSQTLHRSELINILNQELKILKSELKTKGQTSGQVLFHNPNYNRECDYVKEERKVEQHEEVKFLADEVLEWISKGDLKHEDSVTKVEETDMSETLDEMLSTMVGDEDEIKESFGEIDEFISEMLANIEKHKTSLEQIKEDYVFGGFLEELLRERLKEKKKKKRSPLEVKMDKNQQEPTLSKRDCLWCKRRLYLIEKLREMNENQRKKRVKAVRFGMELSFLVSEYMFLIPNELLVSEIEGYWTCLKRFGVNEDDIGTRVIIGKLEEVFQIVIWKKQNKEYNVNLPESFFSFDDYLPLCADAIQALGKIVWGLRSNQSERFKLSNFDSLIEDFQKVLMKIELKLAEMKQRVYRSVSADYESFSKSEKFDRLLSIKVMKRISADNGFGRSLIGSYLVEIWKTLFHAEALQENCK